MFLKIFAMITIFALTALATPLAGSKHFDSISGEWKVTFSIQGHTADGVMKLTVKGDVVTGTIESEHTGPGTLTKGKWADGKLSLTMEFAKHEAIVVTGGIKDGKLQGEFATEGSTGTWVASKA